MKSIRLFALLLVAAGAMFTAAAAPTTSVVSGQKTLINKTPDGLALQGYDPVAYFTDHKPVKGDAAFTATHEGATYRFASAEHRDLFVSNPQKYAPAFGGYCGYAVSVGKIRPINPELWSIVDGTLILQHSAGAVGLWQKDVSGNKTKADALWPRLVVAKASAKNPIDGLLGKSVLSDVK